MSEFDVLEAAYAPELAVHLGDEQGVELGGIKYTAIIGRLRVEQVELVIGSQEEISFRDVCQVSVQCPAGTISIDQQMIVEKYTTGDASLRHTQAFSVRSILSVTGAWTTAEAWRESLVKRQRSGTER